MTDKSIHGRRGNGWEALPPNRLLTYTEAAELMGITRATLICKFSARFRHRIPASIEVVTGKTSKGIGIRRNEPV